MLELRDRAYALLRSGEPQSTEAMLAYVYGGAPPVALQARLLAPLADDPRLARTADGRWTIARAADDSATFTALALTTSGPRPERARIVRIAALHVAGDAVVERFSATVNPAVRVPRYVAERAGLEAAQLEDLPPFESIVADLEAFLGERPIWAQEAQRAWQFVAGEARRAGRTLREPALFDVNELALGLGLETKPTLALVARKLGVGFTRIEHADEEARVIGLVVPHLAREPVGARGGVLQRPATARDLPDTPGVYVMRDQDQAAVYVGKARRLRERMGAYIHRPLGATRRLEGLVSAVHAVDTQAADNDLEALILEDREIRRLQPRFNTQRQQRAVRTWIRRPPWPTRPELAAPRLELALGPDSAEGEYVGPFRNEAAAEAARLLARAVFELDAVRRADPQRYVKSLAEAWAFLGGDLDLALRRARAHHARAVADGNQRAARTWALRIGQVRDYDPALLLLPADPRHARFGVLRPAVSGTETFIVDRAVLVCWGVFDDPADALVQPHQPRTTSAESEIVLRWLGAQRPPAHVVWLTDDDVAAQDALTALERI